MKKVLLKKFLICILIVVIASNFILGSSNMVFAADTEISGGAIFSNIVTGLIGLLLYPFTILPTAILIGVSDIVGALAKLSIGDLSLPNAIGVDAAIITPFDILFNKVPLVDVNFFNLDATGTIGMFRESVAGWYYTMRLIASMVLLVILIYIGIRMATTSIATEKAIYKKMLVDWVTSLALLFLLHYIMLFVFAVNEALVNAMANIAEGTTSTVAIGGPGTGGFDVSSYNDMMSLLQLLCFHIDIVVRITALVVYGMLVFQTISFLVAYIKRMFTIGFLIIIAPLITITYSMDKIGDGKAQALNTWLKEFIYNILIQPFQCILYLVFAKLTFDAMLSMAFANLTTSNVGTAIFAILSLQFIKEGEKIIKKIFGFDKASTAGDLAVGAAMTGAALIKGKDVASKAGASLSKTKNMIASSKAAQTFKGKLDSAGNKVNKLADSASNWAKETKVGKAITDKREKYKSDKDSRLSKKAQALEEKLDRKVEQKAQERWEKDGHTGNVWDARNGAGKEYFENARKEAGLNSRNMQSGNKTEKKSQTNNNSTNTEKTEKTEKKEKQNISGAKGGLYSRVADKLYNSNSATGQAIGGLAKYAMDNKKSIAAFTTGAFGFGLGAAMGDFGDFSKGVAGYGMGSGFTQGIYKNSAKTLRDDSLAAAQLLANGTGTVDAGSLLAASQDAGMNDLGKEMRDVKKALDELLNKFAGGTKTKNEFTRIAMDKNLAGSLTKESTMQMLENNGFDGTDEEKSQAADALMNYGSLIAMRTLYNNIQNAEQMGIDRDALAGMLAGNIVTPQGTIPGQPTVERTIERNTEKTEVEGTTEREEHYDETHEIVYKDTSAIIEAVRAQLEAPTPSTFDSSKIDDVNRNIDQLNSLIKTLESSEQQVKTEVFNGVKDVNTRIADHNAMVESLKTQLGQFETRRNEIQGMQRPGQDNSQKPD